MWTKNALTLACGPQPSLSPIDRALRYLHGTMQYVEQAGPALRIVRNDNLDLAVWEWEGAGPPLLFAHATGFHGRCWDEIAGRFPGRRRIAVDCRGHGRSAKPDPPYRWPAFGRDLAAIAEQLEVRGAIGIGHSVGGHSIVAAAALRPETFSALLLVDPTIFPPDYYGQPPIDAAFVLRRRNSWKSPAEMFERFHNRPPYDKWHPRILRDYCTFGLEPDGEGYRLACPPAVEVSIYSHSNAAESNLYAYIPAMQQSVTVMRAATRARRGMLDPADSPTAPDLASCFAHGRDWYLSEHNHFIPMEAPDEVTAAIGAFTVSETEPRP